MKAIERTIETTQGKVTVRGLKHKEVKAFAKEGVNLITFNLEDAANFIDLVEKVLGLAVIKGQEKLEELFEAEYLELFRTVMELTFSVEAEG